MYVFTQVASHTHIYYSIRVKKIVYTYERSSQDPEKNYLSEYIFPCEDGSGRNLAIICVCSLVECADIYKPKSENYFGHDS